MAPLTPTQQAAWNAYTAAMKKGPRYTEHNAKDNITTIAGTPVSYKTLALDKNSATYAYVSDNWNRTGRQQRLEDLTTLKYTVETRGSAPADGSGYQLFLAMHGGGAATSTSNDEQWLYMKGFYQSGMSQAIYVALRGLGDTWDLHFTPASYVLIERLIENFILFGNVNPNQVHLLGFSAGGDGVYRIATQLAQRFSAVNTGGGHPGAVQFENLANLPICLQVGEYDSKYDRCRSVVGGAVAIDNLKAKYPNEPSIYQKDVFIHQPNDPKSLDPKDPDDNYTERHWAWESYIANMLSADYANRGWLRVVKDYKSWYDKYQSIPDPNTEFRDTHAINWMLTHPGNRPRPQRVIWDLRDGENCPSAVASNLSGRGTDGKGRCQNYWLDIGRYTRDYVGSLIEASIDRDTNTVNVARAQNYLRILLTPDMLANPSKPVTIKVGSQTLTAQVKWDNQTVVADTVVRNDPFLIFTGEVVLTQQQGGDGKWFVGPAPTAKL